MVVCQRHDLLGAREILGNLSALPITIMPVNAKAVKSTEVLKYRFKVPRAEAFDGTLTLAVCGVSPGPSHPGHGRTSISKTFPKERSGRIPSTK